MPVDISHAFICLKIGIYLQLILKISKVQIENSTLDNTDRYYMYIGMVKAGFPGDPSDYYKLAEENKLTAEEAKELFWGRTLTGFYWNAEYWTKVEKKGNFNFKTKWIEKDKEKEYYDKGQIWTEGDMVCWQLEKLYGGFTNCGDYYRNPMGSAETKNEYFRLDYLGLQPFSIMD